jgi:glutathione S-transferase
MLNFARTGETGATEFLRARAKAAYAIVDKHLSTRDFMLGPKPTIADLSLAGYVFYPEPTGLDPAETPAIEAWKDRLRNLPRFTAPYDHLPGRIASGKPL